MKKAHTASAPAVGFLAAAAFVVASCLSGRPAQGQSLEISEFAASNGGELVDEDGDNSDWIELYNPTGSSVNLQGWALTDERGDAEKWPLPRVELQPDAYLVVFASGKDRRVVGSTWDTVVRASDDWQYAVGGAPPSELWASSAYDDSGWQTGPGGFGYADGDDATVVPNGTQGVYIRTRFTVDDASTVLRAVLHMTWDDGFVAYLNGTEIARANCCLFPTAREPEPLTPFNLGSAISLIHTGENVLAVEVRNAGASSTDLSLIPYLTLEFATPPSTARGVANEVRPLDESNLHTNFSLALEGEYLALTGPGGTLATVFDPFPLQYAGISYGLSGDRYGYFNLPTPGAPNVAGVQEVLEPPTLSMDHGFFDAPFKLLLFPETAGSVIRYTTDGSLPTDENGTTYTEPILIDRTTVIRAVATAPGALNSASVTRSYIFPQDVLRQSANGAPPPGWPTQWGSNDTDYGMDPDVVNGNEDLVIDALLSLPSVSIVTDRDHLFDEETGIYSNALGYGREWERPTSAELIHPDGTTGFQINAGLRIRGGWSRNDPNPKHAFRLYFRNDYGPAKLEYPLFGDEGVDEFDVVDLRTSQNYSWAYANDSRNTLVRDVWARDTQRDMGMPYTRSRYYHLYLNGQYWGVYQTQERSEASYGESYLGGDKEEYDVIKSAGLDGGYQIEATDGDFEAWRALWDGVNALAQLTSESERTAQYLRLQGKNPDGTRNPTYEVLLDADNLINYMLVIFYTGNFDAPISGFRGDSETNNFFSVRRRGGEGGFVHFAHDSEHTLLPEDNRYTDRTGPFPAGWQFQFSNPQWMHQQLMASAEYRLRFADLAHRHLFNDGALTTARGIERLDDRATEVQPAMLAESARWGDSKRSQPFVPAHWEAEINRLRTTILPPRNSQIVSQLRVASRYANGNPGSGETLAPLYPSVIAPSFSSHGGEVAANFSLHMTVASGQIFYTVDGSDPREIGGAVSANALEYAGPITLQQPTVVSARARTDDGWSPLAHATFYPGSVAPEMRRLTISEINYHPADPTMEEIAAGYADGDDFEFIEIVSTAAEPLDLTGVRFDDGVDFTFGAQMLEPGERVLLVSNESAFAFRYGAGLPVAGGFQGQLSNGGERLQLSSPDGEILAALEYDDSRPWPPRADGRGSSLELVASDLPLDDAVSWRASLDYLGTPGSAASAAAPGVVINEVLTHTDAPLLNAVELLNRSEQAVDVGGWYLSDARDFRKFRIPTGTVISAGDYLVFDENDFNPAGDTTGFSLNGARGESLWLLETDASGDLERFSDEVHFPAARNGEAYGRWPNGIGGLFSMVDRSLGGENPGPRVGPVVIREIMYEPPGNNINLEYVEIFNGGSVTEDLSNWSVGDAVDMTFPAGAALPPNDSVVLVSFDPALEPDKAATFRQAYGYFSGTLMVGGWAGRLDNSGEPIVLYRADEPPPDDPGTYPQVLEDRVTYGSTSPWPTEAAGGGAALRRLDLFGFSEDPSNWSADRKSIDVEDPAAPPLREFSLQPPYPNPARETASLSLTLGQAQHVRLDVYDVLGRRVMRLHDGVLEAAREHRFEVRVAGLASGLYIVRAVGAGSTDTAAVTVVR